MQPFKYATLQSTMSSMFFDLYAQLSYLKNEQPTDTIYAGDDNKPSSIHMTKLKLSRIVGHDINNALYIKYLYDALRWIRTQLKKPVFNEGIKLETIYMQHDNMDAKIPNTIRDIIDRNQQFVHSPVWLNIISNHQQKLAESYAQDIKNMHTLLCDMHIKSLSETYKHIEFETHLYESLSNTDSFESVYDVIQTKTYDVLLDGTLIEYALPTLELIDNTALKYEKKLRTYQSFRRDMRFIKNHKKYTKVLYFIEQTIDVLHVANNVQDAYKHVQSLLNDVVAIKSVELEQKKLMWQLLPDAFKQHTHI